MQLKLNGTLVGIETPEDVNETRVASYLSGALDTEVRPYRTARGEIKYEIRKCVTIEQLADALKSINATIARKPDGKLDFEEGVTRETRDETRRIIETKLNMLGLASTTVRTAGSNLLVIDLAGIDIKTAESLVGKPGKFEIRIQTNGTGGEIKVGEHLSEIENITEHVIYGSEGIRSVSMVPERSKSGSWGAPFRPVSYTHLTLPTN